MCTSEMKYPCFLAIHESELYVTDSSLDKIRVFNIYDNKFVRNIYLNEKIWSLVIYKSQIYLKSNDKAIIFV